MRVYDNVNVKMSCQIFGPSVLIVVKGEEKDIELVYNGFYNFGATENKEVEYTTHDKDIACFRSTKENMHKFFFNKAFHRYVDKWPKKKYGEVDNKGIWPFCLEQADKNMAELLTNKFPFITSIRTKDNHLYALCDSMSAETCDDNFQESIMKNVLGYGHTDPQSVKKILQEIEVSEALDENDDRAWLY